MPFLTLEDPNAKIKGSRDPLGTVPIWISFARHLIVNLTTPSTSVRGFTILLLARYFTHQLIEERSISRDKYLDVFLRMEQLGAYARYVGHNVEGDIRGIERVKKFIDDNKGKVYLQPDRRGALLADQRIYGLWGLFSVPARVSGLIPDGPLGVEKTAAEFIERHYIPKLNEIRTPLLRLLAKGGQINIKNDPILKAMAKVLPEKFNAEEASFYSEYLRDAVHARANGIKLQKRFSELLGKYTDLEKSVSREEMVLLKEKSQQYDHAIAHQLDRIIHLESLFAPADAIFNFILSQNGQTLKEVASKLSNEWGNSVPNLDANYFQELLPEIKNSSDNQIATKIAQCQSSLAAGEYEEAIKSFLQWNANVMESRKSSPWVKLNDSGCIDVRYKGGVRELPSGDELQNMWRNSYFINSLKSISRQLRNTK